MSETRIEATDRLRREGRWTEACSFRERQRQLLRMAGMKRHEAKQAAWQAMLAEFPPVAANSLEPEYVTVIYDGPCTAEEARKDVVWVYQNLGADPKVMRPKSARTPGAYSLWHWARQNPSVFIAQLLLKALAANEHRPNVKAKKVPSVDMHKLIQWYGNHLDRQQEGENGPSAA